MFTSLRFSRFKRGAIGCLVAVATLALTPTIAVAQDSDEPVKVLFNNDRATQEAQQLLQEGRFDEAAEIFRKQVDANPANGRAWFFLGFSLHGAGKLTEALPVHLMAAEWPQAAPTAMYNAACVYSLWNQPDQAFKWLNKAVDAGFSGADHLREDADMANIRDDPRFDTVIAKIEGGVPTASQPSEKKGATESASGDAERHFDFWVGQWDVYNPKGQKVGSNVISKRLNGELIYESWTSAGGGKGESMNFYDPGVGAWRQVWVSQFGDVIEYQGSFRNGAMRFTGTYKVPGKEVELARSSFTPNADGSVRQFIEHSRDDGKTWYTYFDGTYVKKGTQPPAAAEG